MILFLSWGCCPQTLLLCLTKHIQNSSLSINYPCHLSVNRWVLIFAKIYDFLYAIFYFIFFWNLNLIVSTSFLWIFRLPFWLGSVLDVSINGNISIRRPMNLDTVSIMKDSLSLAIHLLPNRVVRVIWTDVSLLPISHFNDIIDKLYLILGFYFL
jgi:hypothetical protein